MTKLIPVFVSVAVLALAACTPATGVGTSISRVPRKAAPRVAQAAPSAPASAKPQASVAPSPLATLPASTPAPNGTATPVTTPTIFRPTAAPDAPVPSGYVPPLPDSAFPSPTAASPQAVSTATPAPTPSLLDAVVASNSLPYGYGELTGYVVEPDPAVAGSYRAVPNVSVSITYDEDTTKRAALTSASNGTYRLPEVALGAYNIRVEKSGYAADSAPTTVRIYPGYQTGHTVFLIIPAL